MEHKFDHRSFLRVAETSLSIGALYSVFPALTRSVGAKRLRAHLRSSTAKPPRHSRSFN